MVEYGRGIESEPRVDPSLAADPRAVIDLRSGEAQIHLGTEEERTARATELLFALRPRPKPPSRFSRLFGDLRWIPALSMLATMMLFSWITADAIVQGQPVTAVSRFIVGISLGAVCLIVHRALRPSSWERVVEHDHERRILG